MRLKVGAATSVGQVRPINEDAFLVQGDRGLFVVCDGMGGAAAGEVASQLAIETIGAFVQNSGIDTGTQRGFQPRTAGLGRAVEEANRAILERAQNDAAHAGMGTTVVAIWIGDGLASIAHVGDSRLYVRNASGFEALTSDHSLVEAQVQAGLIDREQSLKSEHQNILLRALGREPDVLVELGETTVAAGDRLLLCTDGLTRTVTDDGLAAALDRFVGDPQGACDHLIAAANENGGPDNVTAVVVEVQGSKLSSLFRRS
jgi:serine/threonine protein phosphatase PrpC